MGEDGVPVVDVEQRRDGIAAQARQVDEAVGARSSPHGIGDEIQTKRADDQEERGQQTARPATPEGGQADATRARPLLEQQGRDEEPRQHEEQVDPEVATGGPAELEVVRHHADHRHGAQAVERGQVVSGDGRRLRLRARELVHERHVGHVHSIRHTAASSPGCSSRSGTPASSAGTSAPLGEVQGDERAPRPRRTGPVHGVLHGEGRPRTGRRPVPPHGPAEGDGLGEPVVEGGREAQDAAATADEVQAREIPRQHGGVAPVGVKGDTDPEEQVGERLAQAGGQDDRVTEGALAQEHGIRARPPGVHGLRPETGHVVRLEEPSFHGGRLGRQGASPGVTPVPTNPRHRRRDRHGRGAPGRRREGTARGPSPGPARRGRRGRATAPRRPPGPGPSPAPVPRVGSGRGRGRRPGRGHPGTLERQRDQDVARRAHGEGAVGEERVGTL